MSDSDHPGFPCPCCGHMVFIEPPGSDEICPVCFWQDDIVQLRWPNFGGGANRPSLIEAQANVARLGAVEERLVEFVRAPAPSEPLDDTWRPFDPRQEVIEDRVSGVDYGTTYEHDRTTYYYWRQRQ